MIKYNISWVWCESKGNFIDGIDVNEYIDIDKSEIIKIWQKVLSAEPVLLQLCMFFKVWCFDGKIVV